MLTLLIAIIIMFGWERNTLENVLLSDCGMSQLDPAPAGTAQGVSPGLAHRSSPATLIQPMVMDECDTPGLSLCLSPPFRLLVLWGCLRGG